VVFCVGSSVGPKGSELARDLNDAIGVVLADHEGASGSSPSAGKAPSLDRPAAASAGSSGGAGEVGMSKIVIDILEEELKSGKHWLSVSSREAASIYEKRLAKLRARKPKAAKKLSNT
jgi:hypothetical protein